MPVLYGESTDLAESSITALAKDVLAPEKAKRVDDWSARFPTHTVDVAEVIRRVVARGSLRQGGGGFLSGVHHFSSKEKGADGRAHTKYTLSKMIGEVLGKPTEHLTPDLAPPAGGAARPKDCDCMGCWWICVGSRGVVVAHTSLFFFPTATGELDIASLGAALGGGTEGPLPQTPLREGLAAVLKPLVG